MSTSLFRLLRIPSDTPGKVYLHSMPGRCETWVEFIRAATATGISEIVSLTSVFEIAKKSPPYEKALQEEFPYTISSFPISDYGIPDDEDEFLVFIASVAKSVRAGRHILVHCGAGIGRTGMVASCLLLALGCGIDEARDAVKSAGSGPETSGQRSFVQSMASQITQ